MISRLKINVAELSSDISNNYFKYRDIYYRCLVNCLYIYSIYRDNILPTSVIEEDKYNSYLTTLKSSIPTVEQLITQMNSTVEAYILTDIQVYLDDFIRMKHIKNKVNVYNLTIEDNSVVVTIKNIKP